MKKILLIVAYLILPSVAFAGITSAQVIPITNCTIGTVSWDHVHSLLGGEPARNADYYSLWLRGKKVDGTWGPTHRADQNFYDNNGWGVFKDENGNPSPDYIDWSIVVKAHWTLYSNGIAIPGTAEGNFVFIGGTTAECY